MYLWTSPQRFVSRCNSLFPYSPLQQAQRRSLKWLPEGDSPKGIALTCEDVLGGEPTSVVTERDVKDPRWGDGSLFWAQEYVLAHLPGAFPVVLILWNAKLMTEILHFLTCVRSRLLGTGTCFHNFYAGWKELISLRKYVNKQCSITLVLWALQEAFKMSYTELGCYHPEFTRTGTLLVLLFS